MGDEDMIHWDEPRPPDVNIHCVAIKEDCIKMQVYAFKQKLRSEGRGVYEILEILDKYTDELALDDFITIHYAWFDSQENKSEE